MAGVVESFASLSAGRMVWLFNRLVKYLLCCLAEGGHGDTIPSLIDDIESSAMLPIIFCGRVSRKSTCSKVNRTKRREETDEEKREISRETREKSIRTIYHSNCIGGKYYQ